MKAGPVPAGLIALFGVGLALPVLAVLSLRGYDGSLLGHGFTLDNYRALWAPLYPLVIGRSLWIAGATALVTVLLAYPVAAYLAFFAGRSRGLLLCLVTMPFYTSYLLRVFAWKAILGYGGVVNTGLMALHLIRAPLHGLLYRPQAVLLTLSHAYAAFAVLPIYAAMAAIEPRLLEAARDLGAGPAQVFRGVVLPLSLPGAASAFVLVMVPTLGDYTAPALVGGLRSTMIGTLIETQFEEVSNLPFGAALSMLVIALLLLLGGACGLALRLHRARFG